MPYVLPFSFRHPLVHWNPKSGPRSEYRRCPRISFWISFVHLDQWLGLYRFGTGLKWNLEWIMEWSGMIGPIKTDYLLKNTSWSILKICVRPCPTASTKKVLPKNCTRKMYSKKWSRFHCSNIFDYFSVIFLPDFLSDKMELFSKGN